MAKSKPHVFLCCFGFSGKFRRFKPLKPAAGQRKRPFSWIRRAKSPPPPVRSDFRAEWNRSKSDPDRLSGSIALTTACKPPSEDLAAVVPAATILAGEKPEKLRNDRVAEKIILESREHSDTPKKPTGQSQTRFSLTRKLESFRSARFTQPDSSTEKKDPKTTNPNPSISKSLSFPAPNPTHRVQVEEPPSSMRVGLDGGETGKQYRSATVISIFFVALAIMVLWGRLCAILSTATWIFIIASLGSIVEEDDEIDFSEFDSYFERFKKKLVALKGILYRRPGENLLKKV